MTDFFAATPGGAMLGFAVLLVIAGHVALSWAERHATPKPHSSHSDSIRDVPKAEDWDETVPSPQWAPLTSKRRFPMAPVPQWLRRPLDPRGSRLMPRTLRI